MREFINADCMQYMPKYPDGYFDLAIVDPIYGDVTAGGYMKNIDSTQKLAKVRHYHNSIWNQKKTGADYFAELQRVSKNQIIWGATILSIIWLRANVGLFGIKIIQEDLQTLSLHGHHLIAQCGYLNTHGTG